MANVVITPRPTSVSIVNGGVVVDVSPNPIVVSAGSSTSSALVPTGVTPGHYTNGNFTVDTFGRLTSASSGSGGGGPTTLTGDVTGSGTGSFATTLATIGGVAGTYTNLNATIDSKGRVVTAASGSGGGGIPVYNTRAQLQTALDAAGAAGGGVVSLRNTVSLDGPLVINHSYVTLDGGGIGTLANLHPYVGAHLVVGPGIESPVGSNHYPASVLDPVSTSSLQPLFGLATLGTHALLIQGDSIHYGCTSGGNPLYYQDDAITVETCLVIKSTIAPGGEIMGFFNGSITDPFSFGIDGDTSTINVIFTTSDGNTHRQTCMINQAASRNDFCWQRKVSTGLSTLFLNGTRVASSAIAPGLRLQEQSGLTPFLIGTANNFAPTGSGRPVNIECHGLKISGGTAGRYDDTNVTQTLLATGLPPTDRDRYFFLIGGDQPQIGYLAMTGSGVVNGTVPVQVPPGNTVAFWCDSTRVGTVAQYCFIRGMQFLGYHQTNIFVGEELFTTFVDCQSLNALNGFATLSLSGGEKYIVKMYNCSFSGAESAIVVQGLIWETYSLAFGNIGRTGIREGPLCDSRHFGELFFTLTATEHIIDVMGGNHISHTVTIDDEHGGMGVGGSYYRISQGQAQSYVEINGLYTAAGDVALFQLVGTNGSNPPVNLKIGALLSGQHNATFLEITGPDVWIGEIDASGLRLTGPNSGANVSGTAANLSIKYRDTAFLIGPKEAVTGSKDGNAALTSLIAKLVAKGIITDSTT